MEIFELLTPRGIHPAIAGQQQEAARQEVSPPRLFWLPASPNGAFTMC